MSEVRTSALCLIYLQTVFIAIATALVVLRLYVRSNVVRNLGLDDFFIVFALVCNVMHDHIALLTRHRRPSPSPPRRQLASWFTTV